MKLFFKSIILFSFVLFFCCSCMIREEHHGRELSDKALSELKVNESTKEEAIELLGNPSDSSTFDDDIWYYISLKKQGVSVLKPNITNQTVIELKFKDDVLIGIKKYKGDKFKNFKFNKKETQVKGNKHTILKDFIHNLGRYNKEPKKRN